MQTISARGELTVGRIARHIARTTPERIALDDGRRQVSYGALEDMADRLASGLIARGVGRGDVLSAFLPNGIDYVIVVLGVARAGAIFSPINPRFRAREVGHVLALAEPKLIFCDAAKAGIVRAAAAERKVSVPPLLSFEAASGAEDARTLLESPRRDLPPVDEDEPFSLMFTSGTVTGRPRGAIGTHRARMIWVLNAAILYRLGTDDVYLGAMPLVHSAGLTFTLMHLYVGGTVQVLREFDPRGYLETLGNGRVTSSLTVPTMLAMALYELESGRGNYDFSTLRRLVTCGSPLRVATKEAVIARITPRLYDYYGSTESNSMTVLTPEDQLRKPRSVGRPFPNVELAIAGEDGKILGSEQVGEVWCRNPSVMAGYWRDPDASHAAFTDGWYRTGDVGYLDDDDFLHLVGRRNEIIITGGINVYPAEVEEVLQLHPAVLDCAVVGTPDAKWGEAVSAYVVPRPGHAVDLAELQHHCDSLVAGYKKPRRMLILSEIPKNAGGKTMKWALPPIPSE